MRAIPSPTKPCGLGPPSPAVRERSSKRDTSYCSPSPAWRERVLSGAKRVRAGHRRDRWLLVRVAAQNIGQSRLRAIFLGLAVMLGVGVGFSSFVAGWALHAGITLSFARMGADLVVVPHAVLVNITSNLLTVQPTDETLDAALANTLGALPGVARVAPQRLVPALVDGRP
jgi:hypothetical protein